MHLPAHLRPVLGIAAACLVLQLGGCANVGQKFPVDPVGNIQIRQTTQKDIKGWFGNPWRIGVEDGLTTWTYGRYRYSLFGSTQSTDLVVRFDSSAVVVSYTFSTTQHEEKGM